MIDFNCRQNNLSKFYDVEFTIKEAIAMMNNYDEYKIDTSGWIDYSNLYYVDYTYPKTSTSVTIENRTEDMITYEDIIRATHF